METDNITETIATDLKEKFKDEKKIEKAIALIKEGCDLTKKDYNTYLKHNIAVSQTLLKLGVEKNTILAGLCHNLLEMNIDTKKIEKELGKEIYEIIEEKQRLEKALLIKKENMEAITKKLNIIMTTSPEVFIIQLAEALDKIKNIYSVREEEREEFVKQTKEVYAPLAMKLGLYQISSEINDLAFKYQNPEKYKEIEEKIKTITEKEIDQIREFKQKLEKELEKSEIKPKIYGRIKSVYSTSQKMKRKNTNLERIYDIIAIRVITENEKECYEALGILHTLARPIPEEFDDYIAKPKENGYKSLHTTVMVNDKIPLEVQIRTKEMHEFAEQGILAHWRYKGIKPNEKKDIKAEWIRKIIEWEKETGNKTTLDIFGRQVFAITPKGETIELPEGATVLDFAYAIHTEIGNKCNGAKINGKICQISTQIKNGDIIEIMTSEKQKPKASWLTIAKTQKARKKIKAILGLEQEGKTKLKTKTYRIKTEDKRIRIAKCCKPLPGDEIIGIKTTKRKISVHKVDCNEIEKLKGKKILVEWHTNKTLKTKIEIKAKRGFEILKELLNTINSCGLNIETTTAKKTNENNDLIILEVKTTNK